MELVFSKDEIAGAAKRFLTGSGGRKVFAFNGEMGAGKTTFIQAVCRELGVKENMSSPTFSIINEYSLPDDRVYHIDLYRCRFEEEVIRAGVEECLYSGQRCFVEWPSVAERIFPLGTVFLDIEILDPQTRRISSADHR
jgi:tRNA threonylcarbamoyladenosine biosynthesis protein TsaE